MKVFLRNIFCLYKTFLIIFAATNQRKQNV